MKNLPTEVSKSTFSRSKASKYLGVQLKILLLLLSLLLLFKYMVGMCVCHSVVWSSKNSFVELALSFHL